MPMSVLNRESADHAEQLPLFALGMDMSKLKRARDMYVGATKAENTTRAYESAWKSFSRWCADAGLRPLPAKPETVALFTVAQLEDGRRVSTIVVKLAAISARHAEAGHENPVTPPTRQLLANAQRLRRERPRQKAPLTPDQLKRILRKTRGADPTVIRDRTIILVGFALGWRRSELASLDLEDVTFNRKGMTISLGASKTDQTGKGRKAFLPHGHGETCPVLQLKQWITVRGKWHGPLFTRIRIYNQMTRDRLTGHALNCILKDRLRMAGIDPKKYGFHSLRAGMATAGAEAGASELAIMQRGGWKTMATLFTYVRPVAGFRADALPGVL